MYTLINLISVLIRQFLLPNPYISIIGNEVYANLFNIIIGGVIIHFCAYNLTGFGYIKGINQPASGSLGYLISYCYITFLITILSYFVSNITIFIIAFISIYIVSCVLVRILFNKDKY